MSFFTREPGCRLVGCLIVLFGLALPAKGVVIDDFEDGAFSVTHTGAPFPGPAVNQSGLSSDHALLGFRSVALDAGSTIGSSISLTLTAGDDSGMLTVPAGQKGYWTGGYATAFGSAPDPTEGVDFTAEGHNAIVITVSQTPATGAQLGIFVATYPVPGQRASFIQNITTPGQYTFRFSDLKPFTGESLPDLRDVDTLYVYAFPNPTPAQVTMGISDIRTALVPEPAGAGMMLVLIGLLTRRCRR